MKGRAGGVVTVSQQGAYDPERGWHQIFSAGYGDVRIEDGQHREELVRRFERSEKHQTDPLR